MFNTLLEWGLGLFKSQPKGLSSVIAPLEKLHDDLEEFLSHEADCRCCYIAELREIEDKNKASLNESLKAIKVRDNLKTLLTGELA